MQYCRAIICGFTSIVICTATAGVMPLVLANVINRKRIRSRPAAVIEQWGSCHGSGPSGQRATFPDRMEVHIARNGLGGASRDRLRAASPWRHRHRDILSRSRGLAVALLAADRPAGRTRRCWPHALGPVRQLATGTPGRRLHHHSAAGPGGPACCGRPAPRGAKPRSPRRQARWRTRPRSSRRHSPA